ncbi:hypothetical protein TWF718_009078 [Orbilia javanica]|uniref:Uncharacterized protein n=1 Tax=Orbilia javanica TaxID=47235 RepID=A0AAN8RCB4_9PEZI
MKHIFTACFFLSQSLYAGATSNVEQVLDPLPATITAAPDIKFARGLLPRQQPGQYACQWVSTVFKQCSDNGYFKLGGISGLPYCACYPQTQYNPGEVDGYISQCYNYAGTDPAFRTAFATFLGLCRSAGDIRATLSAGYTACSYASSVQSYCSGQGYNKVGGPSQLAVCACYSSNNYRPDIFDGLFTSCFSYAQTADTSLATAIWPMVGYCSSQGDVRQEMTEGNAICSAAWSVVQSCSQWNQFRTGDNVEKASYFCYDSNTRFIGASRDRSAQQCYSYATEFWPQMVYSVSSLQYLCSRNGDVRALYPDGSSGGSGGGGGGGGGGDNGVPSPQPTRSIPTSTQSLNTGSTGSSDSNSNDNPNAAHKFEIRLVLISILGAFCVTVFETL